ncbi:hypothetical protein B0T10DRAFT_493532 [Thelonectria olida]|uniref:Uncharacterized protein n=1 Tax=Thelonectria olida TaxID=1576542 RepID=A0A9P9AL31_9HYPO|nr:hypothetical protein B0T10DRAFT_493532 [Thelonectria olida]
MAAQALAANGAKVYISGRTKEKLDRAVETHAKGTAGELIGIQADVGNKQGIQDLYKEISQREKCLCILVNNAGVASSHLDTTASDAQGLRRNLFEQGQSTFAEWTETYNTNVASLFFMTSAFLPLLEKSSETHKGWSATVINITSISGMIMDAQRHFAYNASKGAAIHLNRMLAAEIASSGIKVRVNSIAPGVFPSEMTTQESDEGQKSGLPKEEYEGKVPAARPGKDEDMAATVLFVATNQYLNGQNIAVDGGFTLAAGM